MLLKITIDHDAITGWARRRGAVPATFQGKERPWPLKFSFGPTSGLVEISWDEFFAEFERSDLSFVYRDTGPDGELDNFHEFVNRSAVPELTSSNKSTIIEWAA
jgi:hypothetical protein